MGLNNRSSPIGLVNWILPTTHFVLAVPVNTKYLLLYKQ